MITLLTVLASILLCSLCLWGLIAIGVKMCITLIPLLLVVLIVITIKKLCKEEKKEDK